jgi:hypothetical protein
MIKGWICVTGGDFATMVNTITAATPVIPKTRKSKGKERR